MEQFTLRLKKDDLEKVKAIAKEQDRSINYILSEIVCFVYCNNTIFYAKKS